MALSAPPSDPRIKGAAVREFFLWYAETHGFEVAHRLADGLPPELASMLDRSRPALGILASSWYPTALTNHMLDRLVAGRSDEEARLLARQANQFTVPRVLRGVYRALYKAVATPQLYARHVPRLWRQLHSTGDRTLTLTGPGEAHSIVEHWPGHHPFLCWITIYTMVSLFELMGYEHVAADRLACVSRGATRCETLLRYR